MTQKELADGLCTQPMISKIEGNELNPSIGLIYKLAERLQVPFSYFDKEESDIHAHYPDTEELITLLRKKLEQREYGVVAFLLEKNQERFLTSTSSDELLFFEWIQGLLSYYLDQDSEKAIEQLTEIPVSLPHRSMVVEVLISIGVLYYEERAYSDACVFFQKAQTWLPQDVSYRLKVKLYFNYSLCLKQMEETDKALFLLMNAIESLVQENSMYLLGDCMYQKALCLYELGVFEETKKELEMAQMIFHLQKNELFEIKTKVSLDKLKRKQEETREKKDGKETL